MNPKPSIARMMGRAIGLDAILLLIYYFAVKWAGHTPGQPEITLVVSILLTHWVMWLSSSVVTVSLDKVLRQRETELAQKSGTVDPWEFQRALMRASGQELPNAPTLDRGSLLYAALMMEELGETLDAVAKALLSVQQFHNTPEHGNMILIRILLKQHAEELEHGSKRFREILVETPAFKFALSTEEATQILAGTTDVAVVNAGFALACGLPGAAGYEEVGSSNLSKVNPATGVIDKTPDGKWIKGRDYFKPDLRKVIHDSRGYAKMSGVNHD